MRAICKYVREARERERERERKREGGETWSERVVRGAALRKKKKVCRAEKKTPYK